MDKQSYYRTLTILGSIIILLIVFVAALLMNPTIETQIVEVPKEVIVEKEIVVEKEVPVEIEVEKEVIVEVEKIVEKEVVVEKEPAYVYNVTAEEREMLARLVYREANIESIECQKAVVSVVINRLQSGTWGDTIEKVIFAPDQFSPASLLYKTTPNNTNYEAVDYVLRYGCTVPEYVQFFRADYGFSNSWNDYNEYKQMSNTYFGYFKKDKQ